MTSLLSVSNAMADLVETVGQGVVRVDARRRMLASGLLWSSDGVVVTSHHVVERDEGIRVGLADGRVVDGSLVGRDPSTDLAVLRVDAGSLPVPTWVNADALRVGHLALALGRPGHTVQATLGIVSALGAAWRTPAGGEVTHYLQTDVVMYPGFSGGPLAVADGAVAGINTSALMRGTSLAVPTDTVRRVVDALLAHGRVPRGYLGVGLQPVRLAQALQDELGQETGLMIMSVEDDGPAAAANIAQGDILVALDGAPVRHIDGLQALLTGDRVGKQVTAKLVRGGAVTETGVTVGQR